MSGLRANAQAAEVRERTPGRTVARLTLAVTGVRQSFTTENSNVPGQSIDMCLVEGPFKSFMAAWCFTPLGPGACKVEYSRAYEFSSRVVAAVLEPVFSRIADSSGGVPAVSADTQKEVEDLRAQVQRLEQEGAALRGPGGGLDEERMMMLGGALVAGGVLLALLLHWLWPKRRWGDL